MDAKQIRFFLEIARTGSFTSAAKKLFISVPGLVKSMDKLEDELGAPLFVRQRTGVCLSPAGRALEQMAPAYLRQTETIRAEVIKAACDRDAQAEVCMTWGLLSFFPANFLSRFVLGHPKINLCTRNDTIEGCYARVASGGNRPSRWFSAR
ncbi:MAG: LysR family transcriptional regulator [Christensenellales bacterium]